jgi:hypothetical protein
MVATADAAMARCGVGKVEVEDMTLVQKKTALCWAVSILPVRRGTNPAARIVLAKILQK